MNSKMMPQAVLVAGILIGTVVTIQADPMIVVGDKTPSTYSNAPKLKDLNTFIKAHPNPSVGDMESFSAMIERGSTVLASKSADARDTLSLVAIPAKLSPLNRHIILAAASTTSSSFPCPENFVKYPYAGNVFCEQDAEDQAGDIVATSMIKEMDGRGHLYTTGFGGGDSPAMFTYGFMLQRVEDPRQGHVTYVGQYDNYFVASAQEAVALAKIECQSGLRVTYVGTSGTIDAKTGAPSGGYQVQVVDYIPGESPDPSNLSPIPPGDTDFCLTLPPPVNNG